MVTGLRKGFIRNIGFGAIARITQMLVGFFIITLVIKTVGIHDWGILTVSVSIVTLLSILQGSLSGATSKRLTDYFASGNYKEYNKYFSGTVILTFVIIILIAFIFLIFYLFFLDNLIQDVSVEKLRFIFVLTGLNSLVQLATLPGIAVLQSINRVDICANTSTVGFIFRSVLVLTLFMFHKDIVTYSFILFIEMLVSGLLTYYMSIRKTRRFLRISFKSIGVVDLYDILKFNTYNFFNSLNYLLFIQLPALLIANRYGAVFSGYYGIGVQMNALIRGILNIVMNAMSPVFNILKAQNRKTELIASYLIATKLFFVIGILILIFAFHFLTLFIAIWLNVNDAQLILFLRIFLIFTAVGVAAIPSALMVVTLEKLKATAVYGLLLSLLVPIVIYALPDDVNQYFWSPLVLTFFFLIYNLHRGVITFKVLQIPQIEFRKLLIFLLIFIISEYTIGKLFNYHNLVVNVIYGLAIAVGSVFLWGRDDFMTLKRIIKK